MGERLSTRLSAEIARDDLRVITSLDASALARSTLGGGSGRRWTRGSSSTATRESEATLPAALLELCSTGTVEAHIREPLSPSSSLANRYIWDILPFVERNMFDKSIDKLNSKGLYICLRGRYNQIQHT